MKDIKESVKGWLSKMQQENGMFKMCRHAYHSALLDSTTLAYDLEQMVGINLSEVERDSRKKILDKYQSPEEGFFYEEDAEEVFENSEIDRVLEMHGNYLTFQAIGAYKAIDRLPSMKISFYDRYIDNIEGYLDNNCPWERSPWGSGGMIDNLGTILKCNLDMGYREYSDIVDRVFKWLDSNQDPVTGLWKSRSNKQGINGLVNGGYHLMRGTYFTYRREFNHAERIIDTIIEDVTSNEIFSPLRAHGCNDLDHFFLLDKCHQVSPDYRVDEVMSVAAKRKHEIMNVLYCGDGGFSFHDDSAVRKHNYYDVSPGIKESDMQGTVFYIQTLISLNNILGIENVFYESKTHG